MGITKDTLSNFKWAKLEIGLYVFKKQTNIPYQDLLLINKV